MNHKLLCTLALVVLVVVVFGTSPAGAASAAGPYYATPSWDQQLPASTRFIVLSNWGGAAVLDRETGLVWERSPSTVAVSWYVAQDQCNARNIGNRGGWRLPTLQELRSLVDPTQSNPALPSGHPFQNVKSFAEWYWSATTRAADTTFASDVSFFEGFISANLKRADDDYVWCVRGGQGVDPQ